MRSKSYRCIFDSNRRMGVVFQQAAETSTKKAKKVSSFKVYEDPVIDETMAGSSRTRSADVNKTSKSEKTRANESTSANDNAGAMDTQDTSRTSAGGWEVLEVDLGDEQQPDGKQAAVADKDVGGSKVEPVAKTETSGDHARYAFGDSNNANPIDVQHDSSAKNDKDRKIEPASSSNVSLLCLLLVRMSRK